MIKGRRSGKSMRRSLCVLGVATAMLTAAGTAAAYDPSTDVNSMQSTTSYIGAQAWWNAGYTGKVEGAEGPKVEGPPGLGPGNQFQSALPEAA